MVDRFSNDRNNQLDAEEKKSLVDTSSQEFKEVSFIFYTLFNDLTRTDGKLFEVDKAYCIKNQYIDLNFAKREKTEISLYGWFTLSSSSDEKKLQEEITGYKATGMLSKTEVTGSYYIPSDTDIHDMVLCKIILGNSFLILEDENITGKPTNKEKIFDNEFNTEKYDTIVTTNKNKKKYTVNRCENIQLLYYLKIKDKAVTEPQLYKCMNEDCNENGDKESNTNSLPTFYYCRNIEMIVCDDCHPNYHGTPNRNEYGCEKKSNANLPGKCENNALHPIISNNPNDKRDADFFCTKCIKGVCSYCKIYGNEKHSIIPLITEAYTVLKSNLTANKQKIFASSSIEAINDCKTCKICISFYAQSLKQSVSEQFTKLANNIQDSCLEESKKTCKIRYELNLIKDLLRSTNANFQQRESFLEQYGLMQELVWTKIIHQECILYLIKVKEQIETEHLFKREPIEEKVQNTFYQIDEEISTSIGIYNSNLTMQDVAEKFDIQYNYKNY